MKKKAEMVLAIIKGLAISLFIVTIFMIISFLKTQNEKDKACNALHTYECEECHKQNLTYLLCSGWCIESRAEDIDIFCAFTPNEGCSKIPKECVT